MPREIELARCVLARPEMPKRGRMRSRLRRCSRRAWAGMSGAHLLHRRLILVRHASARRANRVCSRWLENAPASRATWRANRRACRRRQRQRGAEIMEIPCPCRAHWPQQPAASRPEPSRPELLCGRRDCSSVNRVVLKIAGNGPTSVTPSPAEFHCLMNAELCLALGDTFGYRAAGMSLLLPSSRRQCQLLEHACHVDSLDPPAAGSI